MRLGDITSKGFYLGREEPSLYLVIDNESFELILKFDDPRHLSFSGMLAEVTRRMLKHQSPYDMSTLTSVIKYGPR